MFDKQNILLNIENAIISSFLQFCNYRSLDSFKATDLFKMDKEYFSSPLKKRIVEKLNDCENIIDLSSLIKEIELSLASAKNDVQNEYIEILAQLPLELSVAKNYYENVLVKNRKLEQIKGMIWND